MQSKTNSGQRGRPKKSLVDELRVKLWYQYIRHKSGWTDYRLDMEFGQADTGCKSGGAGRVRVFDVIRKRGTLPSRGSHHRRPFDLVERVDNHPQLYGSRAIIDSLFWELLHLAPRDLDATSSFAIKCLDRLGLTRITDDDALLWLWLTDFQKRNSDQPSLKKGGAGAFETTLQRATASLPTDLDLIALYGALYREACISFNLENAEISGILFRLSVEAFFDAPWTKGVTGQLIDIAITRVLHGKISYEPSGQVVNSGVIEATRGFIASKDDPRFIDFDANREIYQTTFKCWMLSFGDNRDLSALSSPLTKLEKQLIREFRRVRLTTCNI